MAKTVVATILRKTDGGSGGQFHIVVRASDIAGGASIAISREDYEQLHPGMLVTVVKVGWGPLSAWWLKR